MNHRRLRQLEAKHSKELRDIQEQLSREEESVVALREEGRLKEEQLAKLKKSLKDVRVYCIHWDVGSYLISLTTIKGSLIIVMLPAQSQKMYETCTYCYI